MLTAGVPFSVVASLMGVERQHYRSHETSSTLHTLYNMIRQHVRRRSRSFPRGGISRS